MFNIIGNDQQEYGPVSVEVLRQWITEGRANANTLVRAEGGTEWQSLSTVAEFAAEFRAAAQVDAKPPALASKPASVRTHLVPAILTTLCCCLPIGIVAIVYAAQVNSRLAGGDYEGAQAASKNAKTWCLIALALGLIAGLGTLVSIAIPNFNAGRAAAQRVLCIANLKMLESATETWAWEHKQEVGTPVTLDDLKPHLNNKTLPSCPAHGTYSVSKVGESPRCTVPGHNLNVFPGGRPRPNPGDRPRPGPGSRPRPTPREQPER